MSDDDGVRFAGMPGRECTEHRTLGHRAWCFDCTEYCGPGFPCKGCEMPRLRAVVEALKALDPTCLSHGDHCASMVRDTSCSCGLDDVRASLLLLDELEEVR